jgi:hypothetical protein
MTSNPELLNENKGRLNQRAKHSVSSEIVAKKKIKYK